MFKSLILLVWLSTEVYVSGCSVVNLAITVYEISSVHLSKILIHCACASGCSRAFFSFIHHFPSFSCLQITDSLTFMIWQEASDKTIEKDSRGDGSTFGVKFQQEPEGEIW